MTSGKYEINDINVLAQESIDVLSIELIRKPDSYLELRILHENTYLTGWCLPVSEFEAGRLFQAEVDAYRRILK